MQIYSRSMMTIKQNDLRIFGKVYQFLVVQTSFAFIKFARSNKQRKDVFRCVVICRRIYGFTPRPDVRIHECPHGIERLTSLPNPMDRNVNVTRLEKLKQEGLPWQRQFPCPFWSCNRKGISKCYNFHALLNRHLAIMRRGLSPGKGETEAASGNDDKGELQMVSLEDEHCTRTLTLVVSDWIRGTFTVPFSAHPSQSIMSEYTLCVAFQTS
jgi:ribosomal protein L19